MAIEIHISAEQKTSMDNFPKRLADWCVTHIFIFHGSWKHVHLSHCCYILWQLLKIARLVFFCVWSFDIIGGCINRKWWIVSASIRIILNKSAVMALSVPCGGHAHRHVLRPQCKLTCSWNGSPGVSPLCICSSGYTSITSNHHTSNNMVLNTKVHTY